MTNKQYDDYSRRAAAAGEVVYPRPTGTPPHIFGMSYFHSSLKRKNDMRRKHALKYN